MVDARQCGWYASVAAPVSEEQEGSSWPGSVN
jgi:hypothetical protein